MALAPHRAKAILYIRGITVVIPLFFKEVCMARERNYDYYRRNYEYQDTALHTNYNYARGNVFDKHQNVSDALAEFHNIRTNIRQLEAREHRIYRLFGADDYAGFRKKIKEILGETNPDRAVLQKCSNDIISKKIQQIISDRSQTAEAPKATYTIEIDTSAINQSLEEVVEKINQALVKADQTGKSVTIVENSTNQIHLVPDISILKALFNEAASEITKRRYQVGSHYSRALYDMVKDTKIDWTKVLTFKNANGNTMDRASVSKLVSFRPIPWGYSASELKEMAKDPDMAAELNKALDELKRDLFDYLGIGDYANVSPTLRQAVKLTVEEKIPDGILLFAGGGNWENNLKGAFGEFGTALFFNYLMLCIGHEPSAKVVGAVKNKETGESGKVDVQLLRDIGCQVKNYNTNSQLIKNIEVNQHPAGLAEYFGGTQSLGSFLANYFFNPIQQERNKANFESLVEILQKDYQGELLRLAIDDVQNSIGDTVTFYSISGIYFVPGSAILRYYEHEAELLKVIVDCSTDAPSYETADDPTNGESTGVNPYWIKEGGKWTPTALNIEKFRMYLYKYISIRAYMKNLPLEDYALLA